MIGLLQRVSSASVSVEGDVIGSIGRGLLVLVGVQRGDGPDQAKRLAERLLTYRVFADADGRMNLDVTRIDGALLVVPQFTLAADTRKGNRASFTRAAEPEVGEALFGELIERLQDRWPAVETGRFGADMSVALTNEGPVTFWLEAPTDERPPDATMQR